MMFTVIIEFFHPDFKCVVMLHKDEYTIDGNKNGSMLLKKIIMLTYINTCATKSHIQNNLINMSSEFKAMGGYITNFNIWANRQIQALLARSEDAPQMIKFLWNTYKTTPDARFVTYMENLWDSYADGRVAYK